MRNSLGPAAALLLGIGLLSPGVHAEQPTQSRLPRLEQPAGQSNRASWFLIRLLAAGLATARSRRQLVASCPAVC